MLRRFLWPACVVVGLSVSASSALAEDTAPSWGRRTAVVIDPKPGDPTPGEAAALVSPIIYLNRCVGGCMLMPGADDDATTTNPTSALVQAPRNLTEFSFPQATWDQFVTCMKEVYSPFNVQVTETRPGPGTQYHMAVVAGTTAEAGLDPGTLGVALVRSDCAPRNNAVSLTLANSHPNDVYKLCWTAAQESAHAFGLDHSYKFSDGRSACNDPMTYREDCGGEKFFRNDSAFCGRLMQEPCNCGTQQNSHAKILATFGPSTVDPPLVPVPTSTVTTPLMGGQLGAIVAVSAGSKRGISKVELMLNGFKWAEVKGAAFGQNGQPNPSTYSITVPTNVPNSIIDVVAHSCDDIGRCTDSAPVTVTKGAPCADASTCAKGQKCEAGKCFWDPPAGEVGDACTYPQFCKSMNCQGPDETSMICTQSCVPGATDACPSGLECVETGATSGICYTKSDGGGCCSVGDDSGMPWAYGGMGIVMLGLLLRRRK